MVRHRLIIAVPLIAIGTAVLWEFGASLLLPRPRASLRPLSLHPPSTGEPITPIPRSLPLDARKIALGRRLFLDRRMSRDNSVACASCHDLGKGGVDGVRQSVGIGGQRGDMNAPTVYNSGFNFTQFWNGRAKSLEDQIDGPVQNPLEMGATWPEIVAKLRQDSGYADEFGALYGDGLQVANIKDAIATFERSLITPNSRFDQYLDGDSRALSAEELKGYRLFKGYGCVACHQGVNVGGNLYERLGVVKDYFKGGQRGAAANLGRLAVTGKPEDLHVFKVPGLRNVAVTGPYFHDGSVTTLEEAVSLMGEYQLGVQIPSGDIASIVRFLQTLTGEYDGKPL